ncbi:peptidylprolyl isomerase [Roseibium hamelinense]|nr:peptidylprolyl isomerase [Roseibium hamelinense]
MTRLGIDAHGEAAWRTKGFFPVLKDPSQRDAFPSALISLLELGRANPVPPNKRLPEAIKLKTVRQLSCPAPNELEAYTEEHPMGGMPYGMAALEDTEFQRLISWAKSGDTLPEAPIRIPEPVAAIVGEIETFLNRPDDRHKLTARYIYEHLFLAHLHIEGDGPDRFFRMIRSTSEEGPAPVEIATRRPFDDPGSPFFYRLVPVEGTILHKEHIVYDIGPKRLERYRQLFFSEDWRIDGKPPYSANAGGNPFSTFRPIPARARYQFLLDDALFFVRSFIRGPVCYGQVAVNVIEDRFWVSFLDPDADLSVTNQTYLDAVTPLLELPVSLSDKDIEDRLESFVTGGPLEYARHRYRQYAASPQYQNGPDYDDIWDGDGTNPQAHLTVYRNFDNASVVTGFAGDYPETAWVIDYPLFERIYYDLVAGFDVFGNIEHQLTTRLYMDSLRREGERNFLTFMPANKREAFVAQWYEGDLVAVVDWLRDQPLDTRTPTGISFQSDAPKPEFLQELLTRGGGLWPLSDPINRCAGSACAGPGSLAGTLSEAASQTAPFVRFLPNLSVLLVTGTKQEDPVVFTLAHNKAHTNVAFLFREKERRQPDKDTLTIVPGQFGSYPNFFFTVSSERLADFVAALKTIKNQDQYLEFVARYGVRRSSPAFWETADIVQTALHRQSARQSGLLDLNRYKDP